MKQELNQYLDGIRERLFSLSDTIWETPEIAFSEYRSMGALCAFLEEEGFSVEKGLAGMPTAFRAVYGSGHPVIGILGEFDALDGMSQEAGVMERKEIPGQRYGHGCGHHALGSASAAAAAAVRRYLKESGRAGTVIYFGCPAEEGGGGKAFMVRDGVFDGVDCALTWHPADQTGLFTGRCLANISATYRFSGVAAHAAGLAHLGRSALDAVELMNVGANFLREHVVQEARIHYAITDAGGTSPNVVQPHAAVFYYMRAPQTWQVKDMFARMNDIAKGAALMTGTTVKVEYNRGINSLMPNTVLDTLMHKNMTEIPLPEYTKEDKALARAVRETIAEKDVTFEELLAPMTKAEQETVRMHRGKEIYDFVAPRIAAEPLMFGSTDVGDVSMHCPVAQLHAATYAAGTALHSWQAVAQGKSGLLHAGELYAAKVLASTAAELFDDPALAEAAKAELKERLGEHSFESLMPPEVKPQLVRG